MTKEKSRPAPSETRPGKQQDDNIDDMGRKSDGSTQDQPVNSPVDAIIKSKPERSGSA